MEAEEIIQNKAALATTKQRAQLLAILEAGYESIDTRRVIERAVERRGNEIRIAHEVIDTKDYDHVYVVGFGKASFMAAKALEDILGELITTGIVIDVDYPNQTLKRIKFLAGTHPFPSEQNHAATKKIIDLLETTSERDLVIMLISGGGSAMLCLPDDMTYADEETTTAFLMNQGATIADLNTIRKHISRVKGGNLARYAYPASVLSIIFSDVPGNDISTIASGPTVLDRTTKEEAAAVLKRYNYTGNLDLVETPKKPRYFEKVRNIVLLENSAALHGMEEKAKELGLFPVICTDCLRGEARTAAQVLLNSIGPGQAVLAAGETTVRIVGKGKGGRNQEFVLGALASLGPNDVIASVASDGWDNGDVAGALADGKTLSRARELGLNPTEYLDNNDSRSFFEKLGDTIITGRTGTNVSDFMCAIRFN